MASNYKWGKDCKTEAELIKLIPASPVGGRNSTYCRFCGGSGSSLGNSTYSQTHCYYWWHCSKCGRDYDLLIQEHTLPPGMKSPFDKAAKKASAKAKQRSLF